MSEKRDPELLAAERIMRGLEELDKAAQRRVLSYVGERLDTDLSFDANELMAACSAAFKAINEAAAKINREGGGQISGAELVSVVLRMYQEASDD